jgi:hypothetical protein
MFTKIFIRTFPSTEECELFESILQTRWPELIGKADWSSVSLHGEIHKRLTFRPLFGNSPL